jgi:transcriptional regulator with GAF, ATPase, and Fis domain
MRRVFALLERIAAKDTTVLIEGETGTGKEVAAAAIHEESGRGGPFVVFDCSAVSATLIESELFGHKRGAFTGAVEERMGRFEAAHGGTLFLDEIGELPLELQPKLLRALEARTVVRVGSNAPKAVDVRVVAATNRDLAIEVDRGRFREDLYYRLAVIRVRLPPLRERVDDIPLLVRHFEHEWRERPNPPPPLSDEVIAHLKAQAWPGNVRELRNKLDLMLSLGAANTVLDEGEVLPATQDVNLDVPLRVGLSRLEDTYERAYVQLALQKTGYNVSGAAKLAGVGRAHIQRIMKRHGLQRPNTIPPRASFLR